MRIVAYQCIQTLLARMFKVTLELMGDYLYKHAELLPMGVDNSKCKQSLHKQPHPIAKELFYMQTTNL